MYDTPSMIKIYIKVFFLGLLKQVDSGPFGMVYGVNANKSIYCRVGVTKENPKGISWKKIPGKLNYVACGLYGCWGLDPLNAIWFLPRVNAEKCEGKSWKRVDGLLIQLEVWNINYLFEACTY